MELFNVRARYLYSIHYFYFFVAVMSFAVAFVSYRTVVVAAFLLAAGAMNLFIAWVAWRAVGRFYSGDGARLSNYLLLFFIALFFVFVPLYMELFLPADVQRVVIVGSYFLFFWAFGNYVLTRLEVVRSFFRIVNLTSCDFGVSKLVGIFTNPRYEELVDVLNLIEPRLVKYYEPGSDEAVDGILMKIKDERSINKLRRLVVDFGVALYNYELSELDAEQEKKGTRENAALIRRFGYKKKLLELANY